MGLFSKKKKDERMYDSAFLSAFIQKDNITEQEALNIPSYSACLDFVCNIVSSLPIMLYQDKGGEIIELDDARVALLNDDTGDTLNGQQMKRAIVSDLLQYGNSYIYIKRYRNDVRGLYYVDQRYVAVSMNADPVYKDYKLNVNGQAYEGYEFIKVTRDSKDGVTGRGILDRSPALLSAAYNTILFEKKMVKTGGRKKGVLQATSKLDENALKGLKEDWKYLYSGEDEENCIILNSGLQFHEMSNTSTELQLNENKKSNSESICRLFGLSENIISGECTDEEYANGIKTAILPVLVAIEAALNKDLLLDSEKAEKYFAFDTKTLLRGDILKRWQAYQIAVQSNIMQVDEVRYAEDLKPLGLDFIKLGLNDVLYYPSTGKIYTPNTNAETQIEKRGNGENYTKGEDGKFTGSTPSGGGNSGGNAQKSLDKSADSSIMKLTGNDVVIPFGKLRSYSLNAEKCPDKARVFKSVLGFNEENADILEKRIREGFNPDLLVGKGNFGYGELYEAIIPIKGVNGNTAKVTTGWIDDVKKGEFRLTSAYINTNKGGHRV